MFAENGKHVYLAEIQFKQGKSVQEVHPALQITS
jgi:hypothetical protein